MDDTHFELQAPDGAGGWKTVATNPSRAVLKKQAEQMKERPLRITLEAWDDIQKAYTSTVVENIGAEPSAPRRSPEPPPRARPKSAPPPKKKPVPWWKRLLGLK